jgi:hypothetical protein
VQKSKQDDIDLRLSPENLKQSEQSKGLRTYNQSKFSGEWTLRTQQEIAKLQRKTHLNSNKNYRIRLVRLAYQARNENSTDFR